MGVVVEPVPSLGEQMRQIALCILLLSQNVLGTCDTKLASCTNHVLYLKTHVGLLEKKVTIIEAQRDELAEQVSKPGLPGWFWVIVGVNVGIAGTLLLKR